MSLRKKEINAPEKTGPRAYETPFFECNPNADYWSTRKNQGQIYATVLLKNRYNMPYIRVEEEHIRGQREEEDKKIIKSRIVIPSGSIEEAKTYILSKKETLGKVLGVILPNKPDEQEKFWNDLVEKLEGF